MSRLPLLAFATTLTFLTQPVLAQAFDPGIAAPKVGTNYYQGATKAVYHVNDKRAEAGYAAIFGNLRNHINALKQAGTPIAAGELVVVLNGDGLAMLSIAKDTEFTANGRLTGLLTEFKAQGVQFKVCYQTLTGRQIKVDTLYGVTSEDLVPSGVAEVVRLQAQGHQLVKP
jgi:uncharacterized protein